MNVWSACDSRRTGLDDPSKVARYATLRTDRPELFLSLALSLRVLPRNSCFSLSQFHEPNIASQHLPRYGLVEHEAILSQFIMKQSFPTQAFQWKQVRYGELDIFGLYLVAESEHKSQITNDSTASQYDCRFGYPICGHNIYVKELNLKRGYRKHSFPKAD